MSLNTTFRLVTIVFIALICLVVPSTLGLVLVTFGFAHYVLAVIYSKRRLKEIFSDAGIAFRFIGTTAAGIFAAGLGAPIIWASVIHHNFNEVYMHDGFQNRDAENRSLRLGCLLFNSFAFLSILRNDSTLKWLNPELSFVGAAVTGAYFLYELIKRRKQFSSRQLIDNLFYELASLGIFAVSFHYRITILHLFLYHFVFWSLYPIPNLIKKGGGTFKNYLLLNAVLLTTFGVLFSTVLKSSVPALELFGWVGFAHIAASLAISKEQPSWVRGLFQKRNNIAAEFAAVSAGLSPTSTGSGKLVDAISSERIS